MNKALFLVLFAVSLSVLLGSNQEAQAVSVLASWDGGAGTSNWGDALNWSTDLVPDGDDVILIDIDTIVYLNVNHDVNSGSLTIGPGDTLQINSGHTLTNFFDGTITNLGTINNLGTIKNFCGTVYSGNSPTGNQIIFSVCNNPLTCGPKTMANAQNQCIPDLSQICGSGTIIQNMMCVAETMASVVGGTLVEINTVSLLVGAIGTNPVITGLVGITITGVVGQAVWFVHRRNKKIDLQ